MILCTHFFWRLNSEDFWSALINPVKKVYCIHEWKKINGCETIMIKQMQTFPQKPAHRPR